MTEIAGLDRNTSDQATVDEDLATGNLRPVTGNDRSLVAFGILGYLCPRVGTDDYLDAESSNMQHRIALPTGQVLEPWTPESLIPRLANRRLSTR